MEKDVGSILLVSRTEVMIERDSWGIRISLSEVKFLDLRKTNYCERRTTAKVFAENVFIYQERKSEDRRRLDTVLVLTMLTTDKRVLLDEPYGTSMRNQRVWVPRELWLQS